MESNGAMVSFSILFRSNKTLILALELLASKTLQHWRVSAESSKSLPFYTSHDLLGHSLAELTKHHDVHTEAGRYAMELVPGVVRVFTPPSSLLRVLKVPRAKHLLTDAGASTRRPQTDGGISGYFCRLSIRITI